MARTKSVTYVRTYAHLWEWYTFRVAVWQPCEIVARCVLTNKAKSDEGWAPIKYLFEACGDEGWAPIKYLNTKRDTLNFELRVVREANKYRARVLRPCYVVSFIY